MRIDHRGFSEKGMTLALYDRRLDFLLCYPGQKGPKTEAIGLSPDFLEVFYFGIGMAAKLADLGCAMGTFPIQEHKKFDLCNEVSTLPQQRLYTRTESVRLLGTPYLYSQQAKITANFPLFWFSGSVMWRSAGK